MDDSLISSFLLRSLNYDIIYQGWRENVPATSEWGRLTRAICTGGSLRVLKVQLYQGGEETEASSELETLGSMHPPALEELSLNGTYYSNCNDAHLRMLADSVNMSTLHTFNFTNGDPTSFFKAFTGRLTGLKTLRVEMCRNGDGDIAAKFISSVDELEVLCINGSPAVIDTLWPSIVKHRSALKSIFVWGKVEVVRLEEVVNTFPLVSRLGWNVPYEVT